MKRLAANWIGRAGKVALDVTDPECQLCRPSFPVAKIARFLPHLAPKSSAELGLFKSISESVLTNCWGVSKVGFFCLKERFWQENWKFFKCGGFVIWGPTTRILIFGAKMARVESAIGPSLIWDFFILFLGKSCIIPKPNLQKCFRKLRWVGPRFGEKKVFFGFFRSAHSERVIRGFCDSSGIFGNSPKPNLLKGKIWHQNVWKKIENWLKKDAK